MNWLPDFFSHLIAYALGISVGLVGGFFIGVRAEATSGTFHDQYLKRPKPEAGR